MTKEKLEEYLSNLNLNYCTKCNVYLSNNMLIGVWNDRKE